MNNGLEDRLLYGRYSSAQLSALQNECTKRNDGIARKIAKVMLGIYQHYDPTCELIGV